MTELRISHIFTFSELRQPLKNDHFHLFVVFGAFSFRVILVLNTVKTGGIFFIVDFYLISLCFRMIFL